MKHILQKSRIQHLLGMRNGYLLLACSSMLLNLILAMAIGSVIGTERIVLVPPEIEKPTWISASKVSAEYIWGMSLFLSDLLLNVTPSNASMQHQMFLRYVDESQYGKVKSGLLDQEERLKKEHTTMRFQLSKIQIDAQRLQARISGDVEFTVGETSMPAKHLTYILAYTFRHGQLKVKSFEEATGHE
jgi:conjugal transfer pilus assembly protein TraE